MNKRDTDIGRQLAISLIFLVICIVECHMLDFLTVECM